MKFYSSLHTSLLKQVTLVVFKTYEAHNINKIYNIENIPHSQRFLAGQLTMVKGSQMDFALNNHGETYVFNFFGDRHVTYSGHIFTLNLKNESPSKITRLNLID